MNIRPATENDAARWDAYVLAHPQGSFFHRYGWKRLIESTYRYPGHYLLAERDGALCGVLPLGEIKHLLFGHSLISVPFCVYGGVLADDDAAIRALVEAAMTLAQALSRRRNPTGPIKDLQRADAPARRRSVHHPTTPEHALPCV